MALIALASLVLNAIMREKCSAITARIAARNCPLAVLKSIPSQTKCAIIPRFLNMSIVVPKSPTLRNIRSTDQQSTWSPLLRILSISEPAGRFANTLVPYALTPLSQKKPFGYSSGSDTLAHCTSGSVQCLYCTSLSICAGMDKDVATELESDWRQ